MLSFNLQPEKLRNLPPRTKSINWEAVNLTVDRADGSALEKRLMRPRLIKAIKRHGIESLAPQWRYSYCAARLALGDYSDYWGWEFRDYANDDESAGWAASMYWDETWMPKWAGGYVDRLLVLGEQGIGDAIFFASILPEAMIRVKEVIFECDVRLHSLLERSLPGLECKPERQFEDRRTEYGNIDAFIPAADLMRMFRKDRSHFPKKAYLKPDSNRVSEFEPYRGRTGVCWRGRQGSFDPISLGIDHPVSVQYGDQHPDIESPDIDLWADIEGIVALCSVLGKVVTCPNSAHHFSGAVGTRTEIILPKAGTGVVNQIRWDVPAGRLPWYPNAEVYENMESWKCST